MMRKTPWILGVVLFLLSGTLTLSAQSEIAVNLGDLRVVNALVGIGPVDVYVDGQRLASAVPAETATIYFKVTAGQHIVAVRPPNADPLSAPIADTLVTVPPNESRSTVAYQHQFASPEFIPGYEQSGAMIVINDDRSPIQLGFARLTALHLAASSPEVLNVAYPNGASLIHEIHRDTLYGTVDIPVDNEYEDNEYPLTLVSASDINQPLARAGRVSLTANTLYTLIIVPDITPVPQPEGSNLIQLPQDSPTPRLFIVSTPIDPPADGLRLRIVHAAHSTAVIDFYIDEKLVIPNFNFSDFTEYLGLPGYSHVITLRQRQPGQAADAPPLATASFNFTLENRSQRDWTLLLLNGGNSTAVGLDTRQPGLTDAANRAQINVTSAAGDTRSMLLTLLPDDVTQTRRDYARVRLINALDGAPELTVTTLFGAVKPRALGAPEPTPSATPAPNEPLRTPTQIVAPVAFGINASQTEAEAGIYSDLNIVSVVNSAIINAMPNREFLSGLVYTFIVIGSPSGNPPIETIELVDFGSGVPQSRVYTGVITTTTTGANVRQFAGANQQAIGFLDNNTEVEVLGRNFDAAWIRIRYTDPTSQREREGWVSAGLISVERLGIPINVLVLPQVDE